MLEVVLATRNKSKAEQIRAIFADLDIKILSLDEAGVMGQGIEDGKTLMKNAYKKATFAQEKTNKWSIADDTGLFIDSLGGQPGVYAATWAGKNATTEETMRFALKKLEMFQLPSERIIKPETKPSTMGGRVRQAVNKACPKFIIALYRLLRYGYEPVPEMFGVKRREAEEFLKQIGLKVIDVQQDQSAGVNWVSFKYFVKK